MALTRKSKTRKNGSTWQRVRDSLFAGGRRGLKARKPRRLQIDPLEARTLLSVTPTSIESQLINQINISGQTVVSAQAVATDGDGDFVVVWTRTDYVTDANGNYVQDPEIDDYMTEQNVYARYFTNEVQRIALPEGVLDNDVSKAYAEFSIAYGGNEVQQLTFTATTNPDAEPAAPIAGTFKLWYDFNGDGAQDSGEVTGDIAFNEQESLVTNAGAIQDALQALGGELADVTVTAVDGQQFLINFGDASDGANMSQLEVTDAAWTGGFLPAATTSTVSEPFTISGIRVHPTDPSLTALSIQDAFAQYYEYYMSSPTITANVGNAQPSDQGPIVSLISVPTVSVTSVKTADDPNGLRTFNIEFVDSTAMTDVPTMVIPEDSILDEDGNVLNASEALTAVTIKQPSAEFRVNPEELDNPFTVLPDKYDQYNASVAMNAAGDFVITWTGEVPDLENGGSVTDIFARVFSPCGVVEYVQDIEFTPVDSSSDLLLDLFYLHTDKGYSNAITFNSSDLNAVADTVGDELIALGYASDLDVSVLQNETTGYILRVTFGTADNALQMTLMEAGSLTFYTTINVTSPAGMMTVDADHDAAGTRETLIQGVRLVESPIAYSSILSSTDPLKVEDDLYTFRVNTYTANAQDNASVAMDLQGNFVVTWATSGQTISYFNDIKAQQFLRDGSPMGVEIQVNDDDTYVNDDAFVTMSSDGHWLVVWTKSNTASVPVGVYAKMYDEGGHIIHSEFEVASQAEDPTADFDAAKNFTIAWTVRADSDNNGLFSKGVYLREYSFDGTVLQDTFRANSANLNIDTNATWPGDQTNGQVVVDADGNITIIYEGYGADVAQNVSSGDATALLKYLLALPKNEDLVNAFPLLGSQFFALPLPDMLGGGSTSGDTDSAIEEILIMAEDSLSEEQLGRLSAILNAVGGLMRGEANGIMYSQYDVGPDDVLNSDTIVNSTRDGANTRLTISIEPTVTSGSFTLRLTNELTKVYEDVTIDPVYTDDEPPVINTMATTQVIQEALNACVQELGINYPTPQNGGSYEGPVVVRLIGDANNTEFATRQESSWAVLDPLSGQPVDGEWSTWEITFQGEVHDTPISITVPPIADWHDLEIPTDDGEDTQPAPPPIYGIETNGSAGTKQYDSSIAMTPDGDFVIVYVEDGTDAKGNVTSQNIYCRYYQEAGVDTAGPVMASITTPDGQNLDDGTKIYENDGLLYVVISMSEAMYDNATHTGDAVTNTDNYALLLDGVELQGAISEVHYGMSVAADLHQMGGTYDVLDYLPSNCYEIVLVIDANGNAADTEESLLGLDTGDYTIKMLAPVEATGGANLGHSGLRDATGNPLNRTNINPDGVDTNISFSLVVQTNPDDPDTTGTDFQVNQNTSGIQTTSSTSTESAVQNQYNSNCVAVDHSGNFVVVWISYGQENDSSDPDTGTSAGVFMRLYDQNNDPVTDEILVNTCTVGDQTSPAVAMDADGDFVIVWASQYQDSDGSYGIYGQRFNSMGETVGTEFQVNSTTVNDQVSPSVSMDSSGNFIVAWASKGQSYSYFNEIRAQSYNSDGERVGNELRVNSQDIPGTGSTPSSYELHPAVALSDAGSFVVTWDAVVSQVNGVITNSMVIARLFDANRQPVVIDDSDVEFIVNVSDSSFISDYQHLAHLDAYPGNTLDSYRQVARNAQVAMDWDGNFIIVWQAYQDNDIVNSPETPDSYGIYYRRFNADGTPASEVDEQANITVTANASPENYSAQQSAPFAGDQVNPSIAMDADGDYVIVWNGNGAESLDPLDPTNLSLLTNRDAQGVWVREFHANDSQSVHEAVTLGERVNSVQAGYQGFASVAMMPDGSYIVVYTGSGTGDSEGIYARRYTSSTDTSGPLLTDFLLPDGSQVDESHQVTDSIQTVVLTFDEALDPDTAEDIENYQLLLDGVLVSGGIVGAIYGRDIANSLSFPDNPYGLDVPEMNKYQVVLLLDGNGDSPGTTDLGNGQYQIVVTNGVRDAAGNPLRSTGTIANGDVMSETINVTRTTGSESQVIDGAYSTASTADAVAADADGDYVVVWADATGVWARMYGNMTADTPTESDPILVWSNTTTTYSATDVSVARDVDGDFVVTWSAYNTTTSWDVYARQYDAIGQDQGDAFRVNNSVNVSANGVTSYLNDVQRYSSVAMDAEGDFVVTWQSNSQDGSGYGIYAQAYNAEGLAVGGKNEVQAITFVDGFTGTFCIRWDHDNDPTTADLVSAPIAYSGNATASLDDVQSALEAMGAEVNVATSGKSKILIEFKGTSGNEYQQLMWVSAGDVNKTGGEATAHVATSRVTAGKGEFLVNDTAEGNQMYPDVAMDADGQFIITWTSYGQDYDTAGESNIYAKQYGSDHVDWHPSESKSALDQLAQSGSTTSEIDPNCTTVDDPENHVVPSDNPLYTGVVQIDVGDGTGSGSLLADSQLILTAAHVVWSDASNAPMLASEVTVYFDLPSGRVGIAATEIIVHSGYNGDVGDGNDIALIRIASVPAGVQGYEIYRDSDEVGQTAVIMGYGATGTGLTGETEDGDDKKRAGGNLFEATGSLLGYLDSMLVCDFDDGTEEHDSLGILYGLNNLGLGDDEVLPAHGDSGGPWFIGGTDNSAGQIAAIVSFGLSLPGSGDITADTMDCTFGEVEVDTRISPFADWIDSYLGAPEEFLVNYDDVFMETTDGDGNVTSIIYVDNETGNQSHSSVAMDADGDFVITWVSYNQDGVGDGYGDSYNGKNGVFARRFDKADSDKDSHVFQVNQTADGDQQNPNVAMDADGDFVITWESVDSDNADGVDIYMRQYASTSKVGYETDSESQYFPYLSNGTNELYGSSSVPFYYVTYQDGEVDQYYTGVLTLNNGEMGGEVLVNNGYTPGDQQYPSVAMDDTGDIVVVWSGDGDDGASGIFYQRYAQDTDTAGPTVGNVFNVVTENGSTTLQQVTSSAVLESGPTQFILSFGEDISVLGGAGGSTSIFNLNNWLLTVDGTAVVGAITDVQYGFNPDTGRYEAVVTFDGDSETAGNQALGDGRYTLTLKYTIEDIAGNNFDGDINGIAGGTFSRIFTVGSSGSGGEGGGEGGGNITDPGDPETPTTDDPTGSDIEVNTTETGLTSTANSVLDVAIDSEGNYVVVWLANEVKDEDEEEEEEGDEDEEEEIKMFVKGQRFNKLGQPLGAEFQINTYDTGSKYEVAVAMNDYGDFVVVWSGEGEDDNYGIYAQIFDGDGNKIGGEFIVNQTTLHIQEDPAVAMDADGDFVVTWSSQEQTADRDGVWGRRFNIQGQAKGNEFLVNTTTTGRQDESSVAMDDDGDFVVVWQSEGQDGSMAGIYGQRFSAAGVKQGSEFQVNQYTQDKQITPSVSMDADGDYVVAWSSFAQDGSGYGIYARRYNAAGTALDNEFLVNTTTLNWQITPDVSMSDDGRFVVTWCSMQDANQNVATPDYGIYARMFNADGTDFRKDTGLTVGEFRVNAVTLGNQVMPAVAVNPTDTYAVAWAGPEAVGKNEVDLEVIDIFSRAIDPPYEGDTPAPEQTFTLTSPTSGTYQVGNTVNIQWTAGNVVTGGTISLCFDTDAAFNGNETWIEVDQVAAANGSGFYAWNTAGVAAGTYYIAGYMEGDGTFTYSHLTQAITINAVPNNPTSPPSFTMTGPTSGAYQVGDSVNLQWTAGGMTAGNVISLCYDTDKVFNGNEKWIEIDQVAAAEGAGTYTWSTAGMAAGTYYLAGYMWDGSNAYFSHLSQAITVKAVPSNPTSPPSFTMTGPTSGTYQVGDSVALQWTAGGTAAGNVISLCYDTDKVFNGNEHWIEVDQVAATDGAGSYTWSTAGMTAGTYYLAGYMWNGSQAFYSHLNQAITINAAQSNPSSSQSFTMTGPTSGTYQVGDSMSIQWAAGGTAAGDVISLCYDVDKVFNGNEHWIEVDQVAAANGAGSYTWNSSAAPGTYYLAGYMWDGTKAIYSHLNQAVTIVGVQEQFSVVGPTSGAYHSGDNVGIQWTAGGVLPGSVLSFFYDTDKVLNGNEHWIAVDAVAASNAGGTYSWDTTGLTAGIYYLGGYMWNGSSAKFSHLGQAITVTNPISSKLATKTAATTSFTRTDALQAFFAELQDSDSDSVKTTWLYDL